MADLTAMMQSAAGNAGGDANFIEDVFSTFVDKPSGSGTYTLNNGLDFAGEGGLLWAKGRDVSFGYYLFDTARGAGKQLQTNTSGAEFTASTNSNFTSTGYNFGSGNGTQDFDFVYWGFRKQPKFFDVVTYTGNGVARTIAHALDSVPGCIIIKRTNVGGDNWVVWHRGIGNTEYLKLNLTDAKSFESYWNNSTLTSSTFSLNDGSFAVNDDGSTYVAYLFAHDAGGFGLSGEDNVISCGSYTGNGSADGPTVTLGYEPQWLMVKRTDSGDGWPIIDTMRGFTVDGAVSILRANNANAEGADTGKAGPTSNGFKLKGTSAEFNASGGNYIYIAIRRGPMKVPETGTSVFEPDLSPNSNNPRFVSGFPVDMAMSRSRTSDGVGGMDITSRLTQSKFMRTGSTNPEQNSSTIRMDYMNGFDNDGDTSPNFVAEMFRRAPGFFDVVCYTGNGAIRQVAHGLGVTPEFVIVKSRSFEQHWYTYHTGQTGGEDALHSTMRLNLSEASFESQTWKNYNFNSSSFSLDSDGGVNLSGQTFVAYLFASCPGVSKVGSYTGTGTTQVINCGFTAGSRFIMIKRTDSTGNWYVWDSARGIVAGDDPYLWLNSTAAEVTNTDFVDPAAVGFEISSTAPAEINASGGTYIFLAIA